MPPRWCNRCKQSKDNDEFYRSTQGSYCKNCHRECAKESRRKNEQKRINKWLGEGNSHVCKKCGVSKLNSEFYWKSNRTYCKSCTQQFNDDWVRRNKAKTDAYRNQWHKGARKKDPERWMAYELKNRCRKFGTTVGWYEQTLQEQNGGCAICGKPETAKHQNGTVKSLAIDHDHETGKVRGLLCMKCNHHLHSVEQNSNWPFLAVAYLSKQTKTSD